MTGPTMMSNAIPTAAATALPPIFVSHGSPMIALEPGATGAFMQRLGPAIDARFGRPRAILAVSAHTSVYPSDPSFPKAPILLAAPRHAAVYDFGGFDPRLRTLRYDVDGDPDLAERVARLLDAADVPVRTTREGGLDHGIWTALRFLWPNADVPVLPLAFVREVAPVGQFALGAALAPLADDGVLILGTGSITHNLGRIVGGGARSQADSAEIAESAAFRRWMAERSAARDWAGLLDYRRQAPHGVDMHPTDEHLLPWFVAAGAGGRDATPQRLHAGVTLGCLGMDAYAFGSRAGELRGV